MSSAVARYVLLLYFTVVCVDCFVIGYCHLFSLQPLFCTWGMMVEILAKEG